MHCFLTLPHPLLCFASLDFGIQTRSLSCHLQPFLLPRLSFHVTKFLGLRAQLHTRVLTFAGVSHVNHRMHGKIFISFNLLNHLKGFFMPGATVDHCVGETSHTSSLSFRTRCSGGCDYLMFPKSLFLCSLTLFLRL